MARGPSKKAIAAAHPTRTPAQERAVRLDGRNILVSASAGAGKTRVLVDRCLRLVLEKDTDLDRLLVVTFTEAAAAEMRDRIRRELEERAKKGPALPRLRAQILSLDRAQISTIHSFCLAIIRENFYRIGLDPAFFVLDPDEVGLLKADVAADLFERYYSRKDEPGAQFQQLVDAYGGRETDQGLADLILRLHDFIFSLPEPERWLSHAKEAYKDAKKARSLADLFWFPRYRHHVERELQAAALEFEFAAKALAGSPFEEAYGAAAGQRLDVVRGWLKKIEKGRLEEVCAEARGFEFESLPRMKDVDKEEKERAQQLVHRGKERIQKQIQNGLCRDDFAAMRQGVIDAGPHVAFLLDRVSEFGESYKNEKTKLAALDFSDLEQLALKLVRMEEVAKDLRDRLDHVLVDEYQDINPIQDAILQAVSRSGDAARPGNLFMVGDVKQSIYRFRLAEPQIFLDKRNAYSDAPEAERVRISLRENFRSRRGIIAAVNAVFGRVMQEGVAGMAYDESARLEYAARCYGEEDGKAPPALELNILDWPRGQQGREEEEGAGGEDEDGETEADVGWDRIEAEACWVAERIHRMVNDPRAKTKVFDTDAGVLRGLRYGDIAVLLRATRHRAFLYCQALASRGVPFRSDVQSGYSEAMEIKDMLNLLRVIDNPRQDVPLAAVLRSPIVGLSEPDLAEIRLAGEGGDYCDALAAATGRKGELGETIKRFLDDLDRWRTVARRRPLAELVHVLFRDTHYFDYVAGLRNGAQRQANLRRLHDRACQFDRFAHHGLARFLRFIESLKEAEFDLGAAPVLSDAEDAVYVTSIHKSKGLEFPIVFLPDLARAFNVDDEKKPLLFDRELYVGAQRVDIERGVRCSTLSHEVIARQLRLHTLAEEMRILYVALTRARERLVLSAATDVAATKAKHQPVVSAGSDLPSFALSDARSMLDWVWPAVAGIEGGEALIEDGLRTSCGEFIEVNLHGLDDLLPLLDAKADRLAPGIPREKIEALAPLDTEVEPTEAVRKAIGQIGWSYPSARSGRVRARLSVSELKRRYDTLSEFDDAPAGPRARLVERPAFVAGRSGLSAAERGIAAHTVLRCLDLSLDLKDQRVVKAQIEVMQSRHLLSKVEAESVDARAVADFFASDLGGRLLRSPERVRRELPFTLGAKAGEICPNLCGREQEDIVLVQGIVDCLLDEGGALVLIDFKTDAVSEAEVALRIEAGGYRDQLQHYAAAMEKIFGKPVRERHLHFLAVGKTIAC